MNILTEPPPSARTAELAGQRLRVAHVTATFHPYICGISNVVYYNAQELAALGHHVDVITHGRAQVPSDNPPGVRVRRLPVRFKYGNAPWLPGLTAALRGYDLVHLHYPFYFGAEQVFWQWKMKGIPYVASYHNDVLYPPPLGYLFEAHHRLLGGRILAEAKSIIASSRDYLEHSRLAQAPRERIVEITYGVDARRYRPDHESSRLAALRDRYDLHGDDPILSFVASLDMSHNAKGLPILFRAMQDVPGLRLLVIGDGNRRPGLEADVRAMGLAPRVRFAGRVSDEELPLHYALADMHATPSVSGGESFGLVIAEAMATGRPVVASRLPGVRTVVDHGETGFLTEPGDPAELAGHLRTLAGDGALRRRFGAAGRRKVEDRYDWRRIAEAIDRVYAGVIRTSGATAREGR